MESFQTIAFKYNSEFDHNSAEETWTKLENALHQIYHHNSGTLNFEDLYRSAYTMVLHKFGEKLYYNLTSTITLHLQEMSKALEDSQDGSSFLEELHKKWMDHSNAMQTIRDIFMYMDRTFIPSTGKSPLRQLGLALWRDNVILSGKLKPRIGSTLVEFILRERTGETIDRNLMKNITKMLVDLGPSVYQDVFETPFLEVSADFFRAESLKFIDKFSHVEYLKMVETIVEAEKERVLVYLDEITLPKITGIVKNEMVAAKGY